MTGVQTCALPISAEVVKTLENAYRDVRIAYAAEVARYCDRADVDFYALRDRVNAAMAQTDDSSANPQAVPAGGLLIPTVGVGGHCLPKDGILLWWRALEAGIETDRSLILEARRINDASPAVTLALAEEAHGSLEGCRVALLGVAYRFDSEDTRNSPTLALVPLLRARGANVVLHDPYVTQTDQNLRRAEAEGKFTQDAEEALRDANVVIFCTAHRVYADGLDGILAGRPRLGTVVDGCNLTTRVRVERHGLRYAGIGRGRLTPTDELVEQVLAGFRAVERGVANEVERVIAFLNDHFAMNDFDRVHMAQVQRIAGTCVTGCRIVDPGPVPRPTDEGGFTSRLVAHAMDDLPVA